MVKRAWMWPTAVCVGVVTMMFALTATAVGYSVPGTSTWGPSVLDLPGNNFFPESITASPDGTIYTSSIVTGEIVKFAPLSSTPQPFVAAGVNTNTAGVFFDPVRRVLFSCSVDLSFTNPTALQAWDASTGALKASYTIPNGGVCGDITVGPGGVVYVTDASNPTASPRQPSRILRLTTPSPFSATGGTLSVWSSDPAFNGATNGLQLDGIAPGGLNIYADDYANGSLFRIPIRANGSAGPAQTVFPAGTFQFPDGLHMLIQPNELLVAEDVGRLDLVDLRTGAITLINGSLDQPTSVWPVGSKLWVSDGQVLRLQQGQPPNLPFQLVSVPLWDLAPH